MSAILPCEIQSFNFDLWKNDQRSFFHYKQIFKIYKKASVTWSQKDKGGASSWE